MMKDKLAQMRSYWLGRQSEAERDACENLWFENDEDAELLAAVRDELIEDYLSNDLTSDESSKFKTFFLGELGMSREVGIAAAIRDAAPSQRIPLAETSAGDGLFASVRTSFLNLFSGGLAPAAAGAFVVILAIGGFVGYRWLNQNVSGPIQAQVDPPPVSELPSPTLTTPEGPGTNQGQTQPELAQVPKDKNTNKPIATISGPKTASFDLSDAVTMGSGKLETLEMAESVESFTLKLARPMLNPQYNEKFSYRISPIDGSRGAAAGLISQDLSKLSSDDSFDITVPAKQLRSGRYELTIFGQNLAGKTERLSGLRLKIDRRPVK